MPQITRRVFLGSVAATAVPAFAAKRSATDWVTLGNSGVKVTRLAFGTGTRGGRVQRELGQAEFTRLVRYAYEHGIRFFETADSYSGMPVMLANALKGLPRDSYRLMTKYKRSEAGDPKLTIDRYRRELNSEYFDIMLMHGVRNNDWTQTYKPVLDQISESKVKKIVLAQGASCHGLLPLRTFPGNRWLDVALLRVNHDGARMDNLRDNVQEKGDVREVYGHIEKIHGQGTGIIGMKLIGEGTFTDPEQREASLRRVFGMGTVSSVTIGFKNTQEIDEAIERINRALNA
ncbi:MAG: aldo/keto reductase [Acidobacteria bacterium]|nr:aldo/keto reductase [Acidobacteriota bacterium]